MNHEFLKKLKDHVEAQKNSTPEEARARLVATGILNEDGSPSPNYYSAEDTDNYHLDRYYRESHRDWLILKKIWFEVPGFVGRR